MVIKNSYNPKGSYLKGSYHFDIFLNKYFFHLNDYYKNNHFRVDFKNSYNSKDSYLKGSYPWELNFLQRARK